MKKLILVLAMLMLFAAEILRVYFIMPFPGSQQANTIDIAYFLHKNIFLIRLVLLVLILFIAFTTFRNWKKYSKIFFFIVLIVYGAVFYLVNFKFLADKMFYQPTNKMLVTAANNKVDSVKLVLGVKLNGEAKAYPIEIIGYHHQVQDTIGGEPVIVTYCTVCRTGRVFSPLIDGKKEQFRLVGMDHFNAMFEDATTKSWWRQVNGKAITGKMKDRMLTEIPSEQMTLAAWLRSNSGSLILQPDSLFQKQYDNLEGFDKGTLKSSLEKRDSASWQFKSWVIGIEHNETAKAYDWNDLQKLSLIHDSLPGLPVLIFAEPDSASFHTWNRQVNGISLQFKKVNDQLEDINTSSTWNFDGYCTAGELKGSQLKPVKASQEFWHSWKEFHPRTSRYIIK